MLKCHTLCPNFTELPTYELMHVCRCPKFNSEESNVFISPECGNKTAQLHAKIVGGGNNCHELGNVIAQKIIPLLQFGVI